MSYEAIAGKYLLLTGGTLTGNVAMSGGKFTGLGAGTANGDSVRFEQMKVIQAVNSANSVATTTTSASFQITNLTVTITPTSASNRVLVIASGTTEISGNNFIAYCDIFRDSTQLTALTPLNMNSSATLTTLLTPITLVKLDSPASTSPIVYSVKIRSNNNGQSVTFGDSTETNIVAIEIV